MRKEVFYTSQSIILKSAHLYYVEKKTQKEIAQDLQISVPTVSRLLKKAESQAIVHFSIGHPFSDCIELESKLKEKYKLKEVVVVPPTNEELKESKSASDEELKKMVALEAARYVQRILTPSDYLGIAWGGTMYYMIQYLNPCQKVNANFMTLHGSLSCSDYELDVNTLVRKMAMAFGGENYSFLSEGLKDSEEQLNILKSQERKKQIFDTFKNLTLSVSGVGSLYPEADSPLARIQYLKANELTELKSKGVYGDLMIRFFDKNGQECDTELRDRTLAIEFDQYRQIPTKIIAASGEKKVYTLLALLIGNLVDVLIINYSLAKAIWSLGSKNTEL